MRYTTHVKYYVENTVDLSIFANSEDEAEIKALEIVSGWGNVSDNVEPEVTDIFEE